MEIKVEKVTITDAPAQEQDYAWADLFLPGTYYEAAVYEDGREMLRTPLLRDPKEARSVAEREYHKLEEARKRYLDDLDDLEDALERYVREINQINREMWGGTNQQE